VATRTSDVVIVGGGVMGSAVAYDLPLVIDVSGIYFRHEPGGRVLTLDLSPLTPDRFSTGALLLEEAVI